jgi:ATPase family AAA domain-containing protein 2
MCQTVEAAIVQLFMEAKRNQPSVIYIPSLVGWCAAVSETSRSTVRAMLDTLAPTDPVLLLAVVDGPFTSLPRDVRAWFGATRENRLALGSPDPSLRASFFEELLKDIRRPPNEFPDGIQRRKRVLEELPIAPPLEPRQPTEAELAAQEENDQRVIALVKFRLGPILAELKRKFKRFTKRASVSISFLLSEVLAEYHPAYRRSMELTLTLRSIQLMPRSPMRPLRLNQL